MFRHEVPGPAATGRRPGTNPTNCALDSIVARLPRAVREGECVFTLRKGGRLIVCAKLVAVTGPWRGERVVAVVYGRTRAIPARTSLPAICALTCLAVDVDCVSVWLQSEGTRLWIPLHELLRHGQLRREMNVLKCFIAWERVRPMPKEATWPFIEGPMVEGPMGTLDEALLPALNAALGHPLDLAALGRGPRDDGDLDHDDRPGGGEDAAAGKVDVSDVEAGAEGEVRPW